MDKFTVSMLIAVVAKKVVFFCQYLDQFRANQLLIQNHNHRNLKNFIYYLRQNHPDRED